MFVWGACWDFFVFWGYAYCAYHGVGFDFGVVEVDVVFVDFDYFCGGFVGFVA